MKKKIAVLIELAIIFGLMIVSGYLFTANEKLDTIVAEQNQFIKEITGKDSVFLDESKIYQDSLKQITEKFSWYLNGEKVSADEFIDAYKKLERQRDSIQYLLDYARSLYGFDVRNKRKNDSTVSIYRGRFSKADSADITYYFFKNRIEKSKNGYWSADLTSKEDVEEVNKQLQKLNKQMYNFNDSLNKGK